MSRQWIAFYVGDYDRDTAHLSTLEHGAYFLLLKHYWSTGGPLKEKDLYRVAKIDPRKWHFVRDRLASFFYVIDGDWYHKRCEKELQIAGNKEKYYKQLSAAGVAARNRTVGDHGNRAVNSTVNHARASTTTTKNIGDSPLRVLSPNASSLCSDATRAPARELPREEQKPPLVEILKTILSEETALDVIAHRKAKRAPLTPRAAELLVAAFRDHGDPERAAEAMIANGWQGFRSEWMHANRSRDRPQGRSDGTRGFLRAVQADIERDRIDRERDERRCEESASKAVPLLDAPRRRE